MPIYFEKLEKIIKQWYDIYNIQKPNDPASWVSYKTMQKQAKLKLLKKVLSIFKTIENKDIFIIHDLDKKNNFYIKISEIQKSKL